MRNMSDWLLAVMPSSTGIKMGVLQLGSRQLELDDDGHLLRVADWTPEVAHCFAAEEGIVLEADHWRVLELIRAFHQRFHLTPAMRALSSYARECGADDISSSLHLLRLFPGNPARRASRIAGLPRPHGCL